MNEAQVKNVTFVFNHLMEVENRPWDGIDDAISYLGYLRDSELIAETEISYDNHKSVIVKCGHNHENNNSICLIPLLLESVGAILELYRETESLHPNNKYILEYYLAMTHVGQISVDPKG